MLNMNQSYQRLSASINIHNKFIAVFDHLWRSLCHFLSYSKGYVPYKGPSKICIFLRRSALSEGRLLYYTSRSKLRWSSTQIFASIRLCVLKENVRNGGEQQDSASWLLCLTVCPRENLRNWTCVAITTNKKNLRSLPRACLRQL